MNVLLGVCGGVAAYKAAELCRELQRAGAEVQVVMTAGAQRFVTPLTFAAVSGRQVLTNLWEPSVSERATTTSAAPFDIEHISIAQWADVMVIAPATANLLARLTHGLADDLLTTLALATTAPLVVAPAMNVNMWHHPATQANLATLRARGVRLVQPGAGYLACGMVGEGRLAEVTAIAQAVLSARVPQDLAGETVLITAGGTREPIDPVRFIGNRSSGKMGVALAQEALARGARVILITAGLEAPGCQVVRVETAAQMQAAVLAALPQSTIVIMAAAVSDYRVEAPAPHKVKKLARTGLELVLNPDILAQIVQEKRPGTLVIGFAAETQDVLEEGRRKLREKGVNLLIANDVSRPDSGFDADRNSGWLLTPDYEEQLPPAPKREMAARILAAAISLKPKHF